MTLLDVPPLRSLLLVAVPCVTAAPTLAQEVVPDTTAGRVASAWIEAFNAGDRESMLAFVRAHRTPEKVAEFDASWGQLQGARRMLGTLTPLSASAAGDSLTVIADVENLPIEFAVRFQVDEQPPHHLLSMEMRPAGSAAPALEAPAGWETLADLLEPLRESASAPALTAAIVEGGRIVDVAAVGSRATGAESPDVLLDDRFHIGSVAKSMTASMIARLVEDGRLVWTDTIGDAYAGVEFDPAYAEVTLLEVLQHRAGLPQQLTITDEEDELLRALPGTPTEQRAAYVAEMLATPRLADATFQYSNAGYSVAGHWAERVTGRSWEDLVQEHVFGALRLRRSGIGWPATPARPAQPRGHFPDGSALRAQGVDEYPLGPFMHPAGHVHTSARDLARYAAAHLNGLVGREDFLLPETVQFLHTPLPGAPYACGWQITGGKHAHDGSAGTFHALIEVVPSEDRAVVVLTNAALPDLCRVVADAVAERHAERR
ncbi:MAG: serine hydrolase domain-containing protein [Planctomycetota bacterium]